MPLAKHLDKLGVFGSFIAAACCLGLPAIISIFAALGLGFLINDAILLPVLLLFLGITLFGLFQGYRRHKRIRPLVVGAVSALAVIVFIFVAFSAPLAYVAVAGLVAASVLNVSAQRVAHVG
jgi:mercuric ion transport protein